MPGVSFGALLWVLIAYQKVILVVELESGGEVLKFCAYRWIGGSAGTVLFWNSSLIWWKVS